PAADVGRDHGYLRFLELQAYCERCAERVRRLIARAKRQVTPARVPVGDAAARLDRRMGLAMLREARLHHTRGLGEGRIDVALGETLMRDEIGLIFRIDWRRC